MVHLLLVFQLLFAPVSPMSGGGCVHDFAGIIPQEIRGELETACIQTESETTAEIAIVTVSSLEGMTVEEYAYKLFNSWGIGQREYNNGVLFLVAPNERRTRIEVGYGLEELLTDGLAGEIINQIIIPYFRNGEMAQGIREGALSISKTLRDSPAEARGVAGSGPRFLNSKRERSTVFSWLSIALGVLLLGGAALLSFRRAYGPVLFATIFLLIAGVAGVMVWSNLQLSHLRWEMFGGIGASLLALYSHVRTFFRYRPRSCPKCHSPMLLLDEKADDEKLEAPERLEEQLKSVDYDVWQCPACRAEEKSDYSAWASAYTKCDKCSYKTFKQTSRRVLSAATESHTGLAQLTGKCQYCKFEKTWNETIAKLSSSSSSSSGGGGGGGGYSGGSSGGGGASGGW